jgi:hypothetical protein
MFCKTTGGEAMQALNVMLLLDERCPRKTEEKKVASM